MLLQKPWRSLVPWRCRGDDERVSGWQRGFNSSPTRRITFLTAASVCTPAGGLPGGPEDFANAVPAMMEALGERAPVCSFINSLILPDGFDFADGKRHQPSPHPPHRLRQPGGDFGEGDQECDHHHHQQEQHDRGELQRRDPVGQRARQAGEAHGQRQKRRAH